MNLEHRALNGEEERYLILETKGYGPLERIKKAAAERWISAVNADGKFGRWIHKLVKAPTEISTLLNDLNPAVQIRQAHVDTR